MGTAGVTPTQLKLAVNGSSLKSASVVAGGVAARQEPRPAMRTVKRRVLLLFHFCSILFQCAASFIFWGERFSSRVSRGVRRLLAQPAIRVRAFLSQPIMTFPFRQAGKRARPIYRTGSSKEPPKGEYGSRAVFQNCFHPSKSFFPSMSGCFFFLSLKAFLSF
jgi:hypothetical protein